MAARRSELPFASTRAKHSVESTSSFSAKLAPWSPGSLGRSAEEKFSRGGSRTEGELGDIVTIASAGTDRTSGFPRIAVFQGKVHIAWTESMSRQGPTRIQLARLDLE